MATESVATRIPDISDLLISSYNLEDPERTNAACRNVLLPVTAGIQVIGKLLAAVAASDEGFEAEAYRDAGYLVEFLADFQGCLHHMIENSSYDLRERVQQKKAAA